MNTQAVTLDNFVRAETDTYFQKSAENGVGKLRHRREPATVDQQTVVRMNRDTLYSSGVFDLTSPVTIRLPDTGGRFRSMIVINQDHYVKLVAYDPGVYKLTEASVGTRYAAVVFRTLIDPNNAQDVAAANALQDRIELTQDSAGVLELPAWDQESLDQCRAAINGLGPFVHDSRRSFGDKDEVDPLRHLVATARGWGGNREQDALYLGVTPTLNDGKTPYVLEVGEVPIDGFWSVTVYNANGFFEKNEHDAYSANNITGKRRADGGCTIHFGGDPSADNYLPIMPGWNYTVRMYRPRAEILDGSWRFPEAVPAGDGRQGA